jgi:uncharacterized protein YdaU (DUF1376 family)
MKEKAPAFQFYPKDYLSDENVSALTAAEEGLYWRAVCHCWIEGSIPADPERLSKILGKGCTIDEATNVQRMFNGRSTDGRLTHKRLDKERAHQADRRRQTSAAGTRSAEMRKARSKQPVEIIEESTNVPDSIPFNGRSTDVQRKLNTASTTASTTAYKEEEARARGPETQKPEIEQPLALPPQAPRDVATALTLWRTQLWKNHRKAFGQVELDALLMQYGGNWKGLLADTLKATNSAWRSIRMGASSEDHQRNGHAEQLPPRPHPKEFVPPPREPPPSAEAREKIRKLVASVGKSLDVSGN